MQALVDATFSAVDAWTFPGMRFLCTSPVSPPKGFETVWSIIDSEFNFEDEAKRLDVAGKETNAIMILSDVSSVDAHAVSISLVERMASIPRDMLRILLPCHAVSGAHGPESVAFSRRMLELGGVDDVICGAPMGLALALAVKAKSLSRDVKLQEAKKMYERRVMTKVVGERILSSLDYARWEYFRLRGFHSIPQRQESEQLGERPGCVAGLRVGKLVMRWLLGHVHLAVREEPVVAQAAVAADGQVQGEEAVIHGVVAGAADDEPAPIARIARGHGVQQRLEAGEMTSLFIVKKRDIRNLEALRMLNQYLYVMTSLRRIPHPHLPHLVQAWQSPAWLYVQLQQRGTYSLFHALKWRDAPRRGVEPEPMETMVIADIVHHLGSALRHLHEVANVVHRDIKPEVIMLEDLAIIDGFKRVHTTLSGIDLAFDGRHSFTTCGTIPFIAPEAMLVEPDGYDTIKADMWSLGVTLVELTCGLGCVELAIKSESHDFGQTPSGPFGRAAVLTKHLFERSGCIDSFLAKLRPEVVPLKGWLAPLFAGLLHIQPAQRCGTSEFVNMLPVQRPAFVSWPQMI